MKNVLHVVNISFVIPFFLGKQLSYFSSRGYTEYVVCSPSEELQLFSERYNFENYPVKIIRKYSFLSDFKAILHVYSLIKEKKIDIVIGHTPKGALIAMVASFFAKTTKRIYFRHGIVYETSTGLKRWILKSVDRLTASLATKIVCVSPSVADKSIKDKLNPVAKQVVLKFGTCNGIDTLQYDRSHINRLFIDNLRLKHGLLKQNFVIGYAGRIVRDKGVIDLINAFLLIKKSITSIKLLLIGMLEERDALPDAIVDIIHSDDDIIMTGYVAHDMMPFYYSMMDVFVLPSYREGFPTSVLEASSMELPVITTRSTGCKDSIIEGRTGLFVEHTPEDIMLAVEHLYNNPDVRAKMGKKGRDFVEKHFKQQAIWREIEKMYQS